MANVSLVDVIRKEIGVPTIDVVSPVGATVGVASARLLGQNPNRLAAIIINLSANDIVLAPNRAATLTSGILLAPGGGSMSLLWKRDFDLVGYEWQAIAAAAGSSVFTLEMLTQP